MKTIGLIGGMSWESTAHYYRVINEEVKRRLGGLHSAKILMTSVDFHEIAHLQREDNWEETGRILRNHGKILEKGGADSVVLCTNTMHINAPEIKRGLTIPFIHIADCTADFILQDKISQVALLGTKFTMEKTFYIERLQRKGITVSIPSPEEREEVHRIIFEELCLGILKDSSRKTYLKIINRLHKNGAQAIIAGCTEITMLVNSTHTDIKIYDTTEIHGKAAVQKTLEGEDL